MPSERIDFIEYKADCSVCGTALSGFKTRGGPGSMKNISTETVAFFDTKCVSCGARSIFETVREIKLTGVKLNRVEDKPLAPPAKKDAPPMKQRCGALTDKCPMPIGKHKDKPMEDVPSGYLCWLWGNGMKGDDSPIANYIRNNLEGLKKDHTDGIW